MRLATLTAIFLFVAPEVRAEEARFSVSLRGLSAGSLAYRASESNGSYKVQGDARPAGLARTLYQGSALASVTQRSMDRTGESEAKRMRSWPRVLR